MFDFYHSGSQVGMAINTLPGLFLMLYIILEITLYLSSGSGLFYKLFLIIRVNLQMKKHIPKWWKISPFYSFRTILSVKPDKIYSNKQLDAIKGWSFFIKVNSKYKEDLFAISRIYVNRWGKVIDNSFIDLDHFDNNHKSELVKWQREKLLKEIGI